jgi:(S)-2-hydroxyglutarate dehydrogenase
MSGGREETVGIVGGGILGLAVGRELVRRRPGTTVVVFEKEDRVAVHQTGHNSGVVHAGLYYKPGSLKAELCSRGRVMVREYCAEHGLPYEQCGKLVVAIEESERGRFDALEQTATANGVPGLRRVDAAGIREIEPHATGLVALHSPETAITDFVAIARTIAAEIEAAGGQVRLSTPVTAIERTVGGIAVTTPAGVETVDRLVVCAGLQSDRLVEDRKSGPRIVPFRGEYMAVTQAKREFVRGMVYPVPDPRYPFLGVHYTRRVSGELEVGPNAVLALEREGYRRSGFRARDVRDIVGWPGFWRLARQHWRTGVTEVRGSLSRKAYMRYAQRYVPDIGAADVVRAGSGVRAQAVERDGSLVDDFRITHSNGITNVRNAPSPAATSSFAIAEYVVDQVEQAG